MNIVLMFVVQLLGARISSAQLAPNIAAQDVPPATARAVMRAEQRWNDAWLTRDLGKVKAIVAEDYVGANDDGVFVSRRDQIDNLTAASGEVFKVLRVHDMHVRLYGDIAVNVGELHMELTHNGTPTGGDFLFTDVWQLHDGEWRVIASAETPTSADQRRTAGKPRVVGAAEFKPAGEVFRALPRPSLEIERQIVRGERELNDAFIHKDTATLVRFIAARGYSDTWDDGFRNDLAQDILSIKGPDTIEFITPSSYVIRQHGDIAIYLGTVHQAGMYEGHRFDENLNAMDVWHRQAGSWQCVASQSVRSARQPSTEK